MSLKLVQRAEEERGDEYDAGALRTNGDVQRNADTDSEEDGDDGQHNGVTNGMTGLAIHA